MRTRWKELQRVTNIKISEQTPTEATMVRTSPIFSALNRRGMPRGNRGIGSNDLLTTRLVKTLFCGKDRTGDRV